MKTVIRRVAVLGAATALTATTFAGPAQAATAAESSTSSTGTASARNYYGALALNVRTLAIGGFYNSSTQAHAKKMALTRCKQYSQASYCKNVVSVRNGCAAIAIKYDSKNRPVRYGYATHRSKWPAVRAAQKQAKGPTNKGSVKTRGYVCTTRYY